MTNKTEKDELIKIMVPDENGDLTEATLALGTEEVLQRLARGDHLLQYKMAKKDELLKLADRVEACTFSTAQERSLYLIVLYSVGIDSAAQWTADHGDVMKSLDAAKALHDAVLPGWEWEVISSSIRHNLNSVVTLYTAEEFIKKGVAKNPAAAWVATILRAKAQEIEE